MGKSKDSNGKCNHKKCSKCKGLGDVAGTVWGRKECKACNGSGDTQGLDSFCNKNCTCTDNVQSIETLCAVYNNGLLYGSLRHHEAFNDENGKCSECQAQWIDWKKDSNNARQNQMFYVQERLKYLNKDKENCKTNMEDIIKNTEAEQTAQLRKWCFETPEVRNARREQQRKQNEEFEKEMDQIVSELRYKGRKGDLKVSKSPAWYGNANGLYVRNFGSQPRRRNTFCNNCQFDKQTYSDVCTNVRCKGFTKWQDQSIPSEDLGDTWYENEDFHIYYNKSFNYWICSNDAASNGAYGTYYNYVHTYDEHKPPVRGWLQPNHTDLVVSELS